MLETVFSSLLDAVVMQSVFCSYPRNAQHGEQEPEEKQQSWCADAVKAVEMHQNAGENLKVGQSIRIMWRACLLMRANLRRLRFL